MKQIQKIFSILLLFFFLLVSSPIYAQELNDDNWYSCRDVGVTIPDDKEDEELACMNKGWVAEQEALAQNKTVSECHQECHKITRREGVYASTCTADPESQFTSDEFWDPANIKYCNCINKCPKTQENPVLSVIKECCNKISTEDDSADEELKEVYQDLAEEQDIEVPECSEEYPQLCILPLDVTEKIITWFYEDMLQRLQANFQNSMTITDAVGNKHINWGMPFGILQRAFVNFEKFLRFGDTRPDPGYCEVGGIGTCGDVGAYVSQEFPKSFPNVRSTDISMAWGSKGQHTHAANIVMPINPKTKKQYTEAELPTILYNAGSADELPIQWQNAMVLDAWGRNIYTLKDWYSEYKHGNGEFSIGKVNINTK